MTFDENELLRGFAVKAETEEYKNLKDDVSTLKKERFSLMRALEDARSQFLRAQDKIDALESEVQALKRRLAQVADKREE